jgi:hypothetical protein
LFCRIKRRLGGVDKKVARPAVGMPQWGAPGG